MTEAGDAEVELRLVERFPDEGSNPMVGVLERRTRWFDAVTLQCIADEIGQVVLVASGYDCRALRPHQVSASSSSTIRTPRPTSRRILNEMGVDVTDISYAAADFIIDDVGAALAGAWT